jgi:hypothetical protein
LLYASQLLIFGPVHSAYNPSFFSLFFQSEQYFSLIINQPAVFFSGLIYSFGEIFPSSQPFLQAKASNGSRFFRRQSLAA